MSQNKRRPVTYGKSPLNRLEPYRPDLDITTRLSVSCTSSIDEPVSRTPESSIRPNRPSRLQKNLTRSSPSQREDERSAMQRKRRKLPCDQGRSVHTRSQMNTDVSGSGNLEDCDDKDLYSHNGDQGGGNISGALRSKPAIETEPVDLATPLYWPSAHRQKPTSLPRGPYNRNTRDSLGAPQKANSPSPRKRLVDSLGTADKCGRNPSSKSGNAPKYLIYDNLADEADSAYRHSTPGPRACDSERLQGNTKTPVPSMLSSSRVTYSRQRSFLNDSFGLGDCEPHGMGNSPEFGGKGELHFAIASRIPSDDDESNISKPVRSIHELRQAGDNARFREIVDSIFEDIEDIYNSTSGRCCSLAELCSKLLDSRFARRFSEQGFDERFVNWTSYSLDIVSASLALSAYKLMVGGRQASRTLSESLWAKIIDLSPPLLDAEDDLFDLAKRPHLGLSKTAQASIRGIRPQLLSAINAPSQCLSPRLLALECTKSSLIVFRENGHAIRPIPASLLGRLVELIVANVPWELDFPIPLDQSHLLELGFSIFENYSVISGPLDSDHRRCFRRLSELHGIFSSNLNDQSRQILISYVRVILNLTNKEPVLCDSFAIPELVSALVKIVTTEFREISRESRSEGNSALNAVILALGALINLAERTEQCRAILIRSSPYSAPFIRQLLEQFSGSVGSMDQAHSVPEVHENVVAGYLSILLLTVCVDNEARLLVKASFDENGLTMVISTAEKFLQYHREIERDTSTQLSESVKDEESRLTARLERIICHIRWLEGSTSEPS